MNNFALLKGQDSFNLAFVILIETLTLLKEDNTCNNALKASKAIKLWGPETTLLSSIIYKGWKKQGGEDFINQLISIFDLSGNVSVNEKQITSLFKKYKNLGKKVWKEVEEKVSKIADRIVKSSSIYYLKQRKTTEKNENLIAWETFAKKANVEHIQGFIESYTERMVHPRALELAKISAKNPNFRTIDKATLIDRIKKFEKLPESYIANVSDIHAGRLWNFTGLTMAREQNVTEFQIIAVMDNLTCPVCTRLHGTRFNVEAVHEKMVTLLTEEGDQDAIAEAFPFPRMADVDNVSSAQKRSLQTAPPFHGKCFIDGTEVLTNRGWIDFKNLIGDELFMSRTSTGLIEYVHAVKYIEYDFQGQLAHIYNKWFDLCVTFDHSQPFEKRIDRGKEGRKYEYFLESITEMLGHFEWRIPRTGKWNGKVLTNKHEKFATFMGHYLSEGSVIRRGPDWYQISIAQNESKLTEMFNDVKAFYRGAKKGKDKIYINNSKLGHYLLQFGKSHQKFIPSFIKEATPSVILCFLKAYLKGDGSINENIWEAKQLKSKQASFHTSSLQMASDLGELILKIGGCPSYRKSVEAGSPMTCPRTGKTYYLNHDVWTVRVTKSKYATSQNLNVEKFSYTGKVRDVELARNHVLCVRYKGKVCFSGNCRCDMVMLWKAIDTQLAKLEKPPVKAETILAKIKRLEKGICNRITEKCYAVSPKGNIVLVKEGGKSSISFTAEELDAVPKQSIFTHNHPGGTSFSPQDLFMTFKCEFKEMRAVSKEFIYSFKIDWKTWKATYSTKQEMVDAFFSSYEQTEHIITKAIVEKIKKGAVTIEKAKYIHHHLLMKQLTKTVKGISYSRRKMI